MHRLVNALLNSLRALRRSFWEEAAIRQEMLLLAAAIPLAFVIADDAWRRSVLIGVLLLLIAVELLNTAIERLCDRMHPDRDPTIGHVKDLGSAAVFAVILLAAMLWLGALWSFADRVI